jgi:hypothetical protein
MMVPGPSYRQRQRAFAEGAGGPAPLRRTPAGEPLSAGRKSISATIKKRRASRSKGSTRTRPKSGYWSSEAIKRRYDAKS